MNSYPLELYKTWYKQWRWKIVASNGKTVAASTESFKNRKDCEDNAKITGYSLKNHFGCNNIDCTFEIVKPTA